MIQKEVRAFFKLELFHAVAMIAQQYYLFPGIQKLKKHLISQDMVEYIIASSLLLFVLTISVL